MLLFSLPLPFCLLKCQVPDRIVKLSFGYMYRLPQHVSINGNCRDITNLQVISPTCHQLDNL